MLALGLFIAALERIWVSVQIIAAATTHALTAPPLAIGFDVQVGAFQRMAILAPGRLMFFPVLCRSLWRNVLWVAASAVGALIGVRTLLIVMALVVQMFPGWTLPVLQGVGQPMNLRRLKLPLDGLHLDLRIAIVLQLTSPLPASIGKNPNMRHDARPKTIWIRKVGHYGLSFIGIGHTLRR